jgi:cytochrome c oxidase subunit 2
LAQVTAPRTQGLGPGFWPVAISLTVFNIISGYFIAVLPIAKFLPEAADPAGNIDTLFLAMSVVGNAIMIYVMGFLIYFCIVWRAKASDGPDAIGIQIHDNNKLEMWWTIIPSILVVLIAIFSVKIWFDLQNAQGDVLTMEAIGHQFKFEFRYPGLKSSVYDVMHIPVDTPVTVQVTSADVIHSFWVPEVRLKYDMVPGLVQSVRFTPRIVGKYRVICTEFCGTDHANMYATMFIDSPKDFDNWLASTAKTQAAAGGTVDLSGGTAAAGQTLFANKCSSCHTVGSFDQKIVGPGLGKLLSDPTHPNLVTGEKPNAVDISHVLIKGYSGPDNSQGKAGPSLGSMPNRDANSLTNADIANITAYLTSLSKSK